MIDKDLITEIVKSNIARDDMFIVDVSVKPGNVIAIVLDSDNAISIDDCADINRAVYDALESKGEDDFELTVYSAGLSEPLKLKRQYLKHIGKEVEVVKKTGEKQKGILVSVDDSTIEIQYERKEKAEGSKKKKTVTYNDKIELASIKSTKLVIKV